MMWSMYVKVCVCVGVWVCVWCVCLCVCVPLCASVFGCMCVWVWIGCVSACTDSLIFNFNFKIACVFNFKIEYTRTFTHTHTNTYTHARVSLIQQVFDNRGRPVSEKSDATTQQKQKRTVSKVHTQTHTTCDTDVGRWMWLPCVNNGYPARSKDGTCFPRTEPAPRPPRLTNCFAALFQPNQAVPSVLAQQTNYFTRCIPHGGRRANMLGWYKKSNIQSEILRKWYIGSKNPIGAARALFKN